MGRAVKKTTIDLDVELFKKLKQYSLDTDQSVRTIISEALAEKLARDWKRDGPAPGTARLIKRNPVADQILGELLIFFPEELAVRMFTQKCAEHGVMPEALRPSDLTPDFIAALAKPVDLMSPGSRAQEFHEKLAGLAKGAA